MGGLAARISTLWRGFFDALVRDNKVLPPVLALLALLLFAWVAAGLFMAGPEDEGVSSGNAELVQSQDPNAGPICGATYFSTSAGNFASSALGSAPSFSRRYVMKELLPARLSPLTHVSEEKDARN